MQIFSGMRSNSSRDSKRDPCVCVCSLEIPSGYKVLTYLSFYVLFFYFDVVCWSMAENDKFRINRWGFLFPLFPLAVCLEERDEIIN